MKSRTKAQDSCGRWRLDDDFAEFDFGFGKDDIT